MFNKIGLRYYNKEINKNKKQKRGVYITFSQFVFFKWAIRKNKNHCMTDYLQFASYSKSKNIA